MRELEGVNELHKPNTDFNKNVVSAIEAATKAKETRDFIDILSQAKTLRDVRIANDKEKMVLKMTSNSDIQEIEEEER